MAFGEPEASDFGLANLSLIIYLVKKRIPVFHRDDPTVGYSRDAQDDE
jgi:hypothetical protein